eukprot:SAG31_NODE_34612_length_331_cov_0.875000_1_plen_38_part_10
MQELAEYHSVEEMEVRTPLPFGWGNSKHRQAFNKANP